MDLGLERGILSASITFAFGIKEEVVTRKVPIMHIIVNSSPNLVTIFQIQEISN